MAFRLPDSGWHSPRTLLAREASVTAARLLGTHEIAKRCQPRSDASSSCAGRQSPPSTLTSTWTTPPSAQAQPQTSTACWALTVASGAGATITDCGAMAQTGAVRPLASSSSGSLYQRVVNGPEARVSASVMRVSHFTLLVP